MRKAFSIALLALVAAACGGGADASPQAAGLATLEEVVGDDVLDEPGSVVDAEQALLNFAACMRENGYDQFPDPEVDADGSIQFRLGRSLADLDIDPRSEEFRAAQQACSAELEGAPLAPGRGSGGFEDPEFQDRMLELAACLRGRGLDVDDPDFSETGRPGGGRLFGDAFDPTHPDVAEALETCREEIGLEGPGGPRVGNGGGSG